MTDHLDPVIEGSTAILKAAKRYSSSVRRVVATSSFAGFVDLTQGLRPGYVYTDKDWAPFTYEFTKDAKVVPAYGASKALAKKVMWDFVEREKTGFTLATINPPRVFGPHHGTPHL